jgi:catechol 2,3-dioxygenase-like lactoylglutathione lyase family enzyme
MKSLRRVPLPLGGVLLALSAMPHVGRAQSQAPVAPIQSINHLQIRVTDLRRSQEFYTKLLGATVIDTSPNGWTLMLTDTGTWLSLGKVQPGSNAKPATLDHLGIGIDLPNKPDGLRHALNEAFPSGKVRSPGKPGDLTYDRSIYVEDPDGVSLQLISKTDDGHLPRPDATPAVPRTRTPGVVRVRSINHMMITVTDVTKSQSFYAKLFGATIRDKSANGKAVTLTLPRANSWLSLTTVDDKDKAGKLDHLGIGIDWVPNAEAIRSALKKAFPNANVTSPGTPTSPTYNRSIYIDDPDGLRLQLISSTDDGNLPGGTLSAR